MIHIKVMVVLFLVQAVVVKPGGKKLINNNYYYVQLHVTYMYRLVTSQQLHTCVFTCMLYVLLHRVALV